MTPNQIRTFNKLARRFALMHLVIAGLVMWNIGLSVWNINLSSQLAEKNKKVQTIPVYNAIPEIKLEPFTPDVDLTPIKE